jgi:hypothetical protein
MKVTTIHKPFEKVRHKHMRKEAKGKTIFNYKDRLISNMLHKMSLLFPGNLCNQNTGSVEKVTLK